MKWSNKHWVSKWILIFMLLCIGCLCVNVIHAGHLECTNSLCASVWCWVANCECGYFPHSALHQKHVCHQHVNFSVVSLSLIWRKSFCEDICNDRSLATYRLRLSQGSQRYFTGHIQWFLTLNQNWIYMLNCIWFKVACHIKAVMSDCQWKLRIIWGESICNKHFLSLLSIWHFHNK